ncbi:hypothetical protein DICPUDRAFT_147996 [Dictyostelium purpureum]|uniref:Nuclear condensin complex subunit 3 C-terminal domain-containing protein n=1 Tax=Dictyostelium purpureum TaxID=5786 RepID=F0Z9Z2_DICPU|nr:uncharacterized protein DICPUDRAFT_147996 [Dictyostelium purpureum]EGC39200.1 hypothetical protein DICPUDRAFT_147996 [Dictyostelium purpureum]|eukprot:XP_003284227.1 hypothetical protein DICPUDRAFT_147996 [Dictyostelium purpureum]
MTNIINYQNIIGEQFKESTNIYTTKDNNSSAYNSLFYEFDKIINNIRDGETFYQCFLPSLKVYLVTTNETINNVSKFISKFLITLITTSNSVNNNNSNNNKKKIEIYQLTIEFLIKVLESKDSIVRIRSLQVISNLINDSNFNISILDEEILKNIIERSQDRNSNIRLLVTNILIKILNIYKSIKNHNSPDKNNGNNKKINYITQSILECLLYILESDQVWNIRNNIFINLPQFKYELGESEFLNIVLVRTRDVKDQIRLESLKILYNSFNLEQLSKTQLIQLLHTCSKDKSEKNLEFSCKLINKWFSLPKSNKISIRNNEGEYEMMDLSQDMHTEIPTQEDEIWLYRFLEYFGVKENEEILTNVLCILFNQGIIKEFSLVKNKEVTLEQSFYCKVSCQYLRSLKTEEAEERLELLLPTLTELRDILFNHLDADHFTIVQLLCVIEYSDLSDEAGRSNIHIFLTELLKALNDEEEAINQTLRCLSLLQRVEREFIVFIVEIISDFIEPLEDDPEIEEYRKRIQILEKNFSKFEKKSPNEAEKIKSAITILQDKINNKQTETLKKCSLITHYLLLNAKKCSNSPEIDGLLELVILPSIQHILPELRNIGIKNLGIFCLHRKKVALNYLKLFEKVIENDIQQVAITCLKVIFDILVVFGSPNQIPKETESLYKMIRKTFTNINNNSFSKNTEIKEIFIQGFVKLLYSGIVYDPKILKYLLLELFSPSTATLLELRQCLQLFFHTYCSDVIFNKKLLFDCTMGVFQTILDSPPQSPYSSIHLVEVAKFIILLLDKPLKSFNGSTDMVIKDLDLEDFKVEECHAKLALAICTELVANFRGQSKELTKLLPLLKIDNNLNQSTLEKIFDQLELLFNYYIDPFLEKFNSIITKLLTKEFLELRSQLSQSQKGLTNSGTAAQSKKNASTPSSSAKTKSQLFNTPMKRLLQSTKSSHVKSEIINNISKSNKDQANPIFKDYFKQQKGLLENEVATIDKSTKLRKSKKKKLKIQDDTVDNDHDINGSLEITTIYNFPFLHKRNVNDTINNTSDAESVSSGDSGNEKSITNQDTSNLTNNMDILNNFNININKANDSNNNFDKINNNIDNNIDNNNNNNNIDNNNKSILKKKTNRNTNQKKVRFLNATPSNNKT